MSDKVIIAGLKVGTVSGGGVVKYNMETLLECMNSMVDSQVLDHDSPIGQVSAAGEDIDGDLKINIKMTKDAARKYLDGP